MHTNLVWVVLAEACLFSLNSNNTLSAYEVTFLSFPKLRLASERQAKMNSE